MKIRDMEVELVTEYAKKLVWQKRHNTLQDQMYVTAKQNHRMNILREQVNWCITDSPILLGLHYSPLYYPRTFPDFILDIFNSYNNINFFLKRTKKYNPNGRNQTEDEAKEADANIRTLLDTYKIPYSVIQGDRNAPKRIMEIILAQGNYV